jgi:hypothetical protein
MIRLNQIVLSGMLLLCLVISGCIQFPIKEELYQTYNQTTIGQSSSGDVLVYMESPPPVFVSQADTVVASWNEDKKGFRQWFNMVAFDEDTGDAVRKYFFFVDEKARRIPFIYPKSSIRFDAQLVIDKTVLEKTYADEKFRSIAILQEIQKEFGKDAEKVSPDNKKLGICQIVMNESFGQILRQLNDSPTLAVQLTSPDGFKFNSVNLNDGTIHMQEEDGIVTIDMQIGAIPWIKSKSEPGKPYVPPSQ